MLVPYLAYRVLDPVTGAEVIPLLPHPHQSKWTIRALQAGATGSSAIGEFEIPLYHPLSDEYKQAADTYAKLGYNQRIEAYLSPTGDFVGGQPLFSGVITQLPLDLGNYAIRGKDSLHLLSLARTNRTEFFTGTTDQLAAFALRGYQLVYGDDFTGGVGSYVQSGAWASSSDEGLPVATTSGSGNASILTPTVFPSSNFTECVLDGYFRVTAPTPVGSSMTFGVVAYPAAYGVVRIRTTAVQRWECDLMILDSGGNTKALKSLALALPTNILRCQIQLIGRAGTYSTSTGIFSPNPAGLDTIWRVTVNGVDANCVWIQQGVLPPASQVGFFYGSTDASAQMWATQLVHRNRNPLFQQGNINVGSKVVSQYYSRTPNSDILGTAVVTEGFVYRKNARRGLNQDLMDFGPLVGNAGAGQTAVGTKGVARFEFGRNLKAISIQPNSDSASSDVSLQLSPGSTQSGQLEWHNVSAMKKLGVITEAVSAQNVADFLAARVLAQALALVKGAPGTAKKLTVERDITTADLWRELDFVTVNAPHVGLNEALVQVLEYTLQEGSTEQEITGDAWPLDFVKNQLSRMWQTLDAIASGTMNLTPSSSQGLVYDSRFGTPAILPTYGNDSLDSSHAFTLKFNIPVNVALIQRVTLAFSLLPYRTYSSITLGSTGGASVGHTHGMGHSHSHAHGLAIAAGPSGTNILSLVGGPLNNSAGPFTDNNTVIADGTGSSAANTGGQSVDHTHSVSGSTVTGIAEDLVAQGVRVLVDGVDVTTQITPSGPYGTGATLDQAEIDITPYVIGGGIHTLQMTSTTLGRISAAVYCFLLVKPF